MTHPNATRALLVSITIGAFLTPALSNPITAKYPWLMKAASELTHAECQGVMKHDANYWWSRGKCHMKGIRYPWGIATTDIPDPILKKGELLTIITQYRQKEDLFCEHGGGCYPAKSIKLLGSVLTGPEPTVSGDDPGDVYQGVGSSCELILADRAAIMRSKAQAMFKGCR